MPLMNGRVLVPKNQLVQLQEERDELKAKLEAAENSLTASQRAYESAELEIARLQAAYSMVGKLTRQTDEANQEIARLRWMVREHWYSLPSYDWQQKTLDPTDEERAEQLKQLT